MDVTRRTIGGLMALSGALIFVTGPTHPRPKGDTVTEAVTGMIGAENWVLVHLPQAFGLAILCAVGLLVRRLDGVNGPLRAAATLVAVGAGVAVLESVPHILATTEAAALAEGGSTPLYDAHVLIQAIATPLTGFGVAAMAWIGSRDGVLGPRPLAVLGVIGGIGFGLAGPSVALTESMLLARLFMFTAGVALWLMVAGLLVVRSDRAASPAGAVAGVG